MTIRTSFYDPTSITSLVLLCWRVAIVSAVVSGNTKVLSHGNGNSINDSALRIVLQITVTKSYNDPRVVFQGVKCVYAKENKIFSSINGKRSLTRGEK